MALLKNKEPPSRLKRFLLSALGGATAAYFLDPDRGKSRRIKAKDMAVGRIRRTARRVERAGRTAGAEMYGLKEKVTHLKGQPKQFDDATLKAKVESELFQDQTVPKGNININVENGVVVLRGEAESTSQADSIESRARRISGVGAIQNLINVKEGARTS